MLRHLAHRQVASSSQLDELVLWGVTGQMAHIARCHHLVAFAGNPQAWHLQAGSELGQLAHSPRAGAAGQQALGCPALGEQGAAHRIAARQLRQPARTPAQKQGAAAAHLGKGSRLIDTTAGGDLDHPHQLLAQ